MLGSDNNNDTAEKYEQLFIDGSSTKMGITMPKVILEMKSPEKCECGFPSIDPNKVYDGTCGRCHLVIVMTMITVAGVVYYSILDNEFEVNWKMNFIYRLWS